MASSGVANFAAGNATSSIIINLRQDLVSLPISNFSSRLAIFNADGIDAMYQVSIAMVFL